MTDIKEEADEVRQFIAAVKLLEDAGWSVKRPSPAPAESGAVAWMTADGRIATDETKRTAMASPSRAAFNIPLFPHPPAPSASMGRVTVKALEWGERRTNTAGDWTWGAKTSIGWYIVSTASGERCKGSHFWFIVGETISAWANSEDEAKAAAQADYEARILAALDSPPDHGGGEGAWRDVLAERKRQVEAEGWKPGHDDQHDKGELAAAAACYAFTAVKSPFYIGHIWPWSSDWWKPKNVRRNLVKAGALVLAEIERLDRAAAPTQESEDGR